MSVSLNHHTVSGRSIPTRRSAAYWSSHLSLSLAAVIVALGVGELAARRLTSRVLAATAESRGTSARPNGAVSLYFNTLAGRRLIPNSDVVLQQHPISKLDVRCQVNELGIRGDAVSPGKEDGERRVLVLGDSITLQAYLPREDGWVCLTEALADPGGAVHRVTLLNAGIEGIGTREERIRLEELLAPAQPDLVIVAFYLNDSCPPDGFQGSLASPGWLRRHSVLAESIFRRVQLASYARNNYTSKNYAWTDHMSEHFLWRYNNKSFRELAASAEADWGVAWTDEAWVRTKKEMDLLATMSRRHGFDLAIVAFPVAFQVFAQVADTEPQQRLAALARDAGIPMLDLLPPLRAASSAKLYYDWCHPTREGDLVIASSVAEWLAPQL